jgi:IS5 family transposase
MDQLSFASLDYAAKKKHTKRDVFLAEMAAVVPWVALEAVIEPHYPKAGPNGGRRPFPLAVMLRIYCLQQWYNLSDPGAEEVLYDICSMRAFAGLELGRDAIPDETTILNFRHLLERHELTKAVFAAVSELLEARGALLRGGIHRRRDADRGITIDEERGAKARSRDALIEEGQPVVLWHEGTHRRRC